MTVGEIAREIKAVAEVTKDLDRQVSGCCVSDLLSDVLANSNEGDLWITHQSHPNVVAVASVRGLSGVIITGSRNLEVDMLQKAEAEGVNIFKSDSTTFEVAGAVYVLLNK